nr:hypothetical protein [Tanacetum cinerariifolium]
MDSLSRMLLCPRKACHVRLASSGSCLHGIQLSYGPSYFSCLVGPGAHCDNTVQAQRPGKPIIRHQVPQSSISIACGVVACGRDVIPKSFEFNAEHYATLVVYLASFHKYPEPFIWLVGMSRNYTLDENTYPQFLCDNDEEIDLLYFIRTADPTMVRIGERRRDEDEPKLLETTLGRVVPLLPVAPDRSSGELEASVNKLFDEGGSGEQAEQGVGIQLVSEGEEIVAEDVAPL